MSPRALWVVGPLQGALAEVPLAPLGPGQVALRSIVSGVSRGTEALVWRGRVPQSEHLRMRGPNQWGSFPFPVAYGYCLVARVDGGELPVDTEVFCLAPHCEGLVLPAREVVPLPPGLPPTRAVLAANLETAINAVWDARVGPGDRVSVVGAGVVGALVAWLVARIPGTRVQIVDSDPERAAVAARFGASFTVAEGAGPTQDPDADMVFHASGDPRGLGTALGLAGQESAVIELSWYGDRPVSLPLGGSFHARRQRLIASQVGQLPADRRARWTHRRRLELALELLAADARGPDDLAVLIGASCIFEQSPAAVAAWLGAPSDGRCACIRYPD